MPAQGSATRDRILDAAFDTLRRDGFARTSARTIARTGTFNRALIYYHFGSVNDVLLAALDRVAAARMERYRQALSNAAGMVELARLARELYLEDIECGHSTVLAQLFTASSGNAALREQMLSRMQPWLDFTDHLVRRCLQGSALGSLVDARTVAGAVLALYVGVDVLLHLDGDPFRATAMFDLGDRLAATFGPLLEGTTRSALRGRPASWELCSPPLAGLRRPGPGDGSRLRQSPRPRWRGNC